MQGLEQADHLVVLVGSSNAPRSHRNPFTFDERRDMILNSIPGNLRQRVAVKPLEVTVALVAAEAVLGIADLMKHPQ